MREEDRQIIDRVAWALHCWTCPLCHRDGLNAMATSGQDHVTEDLRMQAAFLVGALGLTMDPPARYSEEDSGGSH